MAYVQTSSLIPAPQKEVFEYASDFKHLPEWLGETLQVSFPQVPEPVKLGREYTFHMTRFGVTREICVRVEQFKPSELIVNRQVHGFFLHWVHTQKFEVHDQNTTLLTDLIEYTMPFGLIGQLADDLYVRQDIAAIMNQRYERIAQHFKDL